MTENPAPLEPEELKLWQAKINTANRNNIFCHCRRCGWEWIDSKFDVLCRCGSKDVQTISCWQFPDG